MKLDIWVENHKTYLHAPVRSGLFQIQLDENTVADFLADLGKTGKKRKTTVYKFMGISTPPTRLSQRLSKTDSQVEGSQNAKSEHIKRLEAQDG